MWDLFKHLMGLVARTVVIGQLAKLAFFYLSYCNLASDNRKTDKISPITTGQIVIGQLAKSKKRCSFCRFDWPIWPVVLLASCNRTTGQIGIFLFFQLSYWNLASGNRKTGKIGQLSYYNWPNSKSVVLSTDLTDQFGQLSYWPVVIGQQLWILHVVIGGQLAQ